MKLHGNARTCPHSRALAIRRIERKGWTLGAAAEAAGISVRTVSKWRRRYREEGEQGLLDRSSRPQRIPQRTSEERVEAIAALRRERLTGLGDRRAAADAGLDGVDDPGVCPILCVGRA